MRTTTSPALRGSLLFVLDQAVCSLLTGVVIARALLPVAFGVYSLYFTGVLLLTGFQSALITGPARVLGVRPSGVAAGGYFRAQVRLQLQELARVINLTRMPFGAPLKLDLITYGLGQKRDSETASLTSALPPRADIAGVGERRPKRPIAVQPGTPSLQPQNFKLNRAAALAVWRLLAA